MTYSTRPVRDPCAPLTHWYTINYIAYKRVQLNIREGEDRIVACARCWDDEVPHVFRLVVRNRGGIVDPRHVPYTGADRPRMVSYCGTPPRAFVVRTKTESENRHVAAFRLRLTGRSYKSVGDYFEVSAERARQMTLVAQRYLRERPAVRARFPDVALIADTYRPSMRLHNYGRPASGAAHHALPLRLVVNPPTDSA